MKAPKKPASVKKGSKATKVAKDTALPAGEAPVKEKHDARGRPTLYTREISDLICERMSNGETLNTICRTEGYPARPTVILWSQKDIDGFADRYARAREALYDHWEDEAVDIADDGRNDWIERQRADGQITSSFNKENVERSRLRVESRKWMLTKLRNTKFGDKIEAKHTGDAAFLGVWQHISPKKTD